MSTLSVKQLIADGSLSLGKPYRQFFSTSKKRTGIFELSMYSIGKRAFVYFYARLDGSEMPCRSYRVQRSTLISDLVNDLKRV